MDGTNWDGENAKLSSWVNDKINDKLATVIRMKGVWHESDPLPTSQFDSGSYSPMKRRHVVC